MICMSLVAWFVRTFLTIWAARQVLFLRMYDHNHLTTTTSIIEINVLHTKKCKKKKEKGKSQFSPNSLITNYDNYFFFNSGFNFCQKF